MTFFEFLGCDLGVCLENWKYWDDHLNVFVFTLCPSLALFKKALELTEGSSLTASSCIHIAEDDQSTDLQIAVSYKTLVKTWWRYWTASHPLNRAVGTFLLGIAHEATGGPDKHSPQWTLAYRLIEQCDSPLIMRTIHLFVNKGWYFDDMD